MDHAILKKRLSTYKTEGGYLKGVDDELLVDILAAWESWSGASKEFYSALGTSHTQMGSLMGRAKKLKRQGLVPSTSFKEIKIEDSVSTEVCFGAMVLHWKSKHKIEFSKVDYLLDFLKKAS